MAEYDIYNSVGWKDGEGTPLNAQNLGHMDEYIGKANNGGNTPRFTNSDSVDDTEELPLEWIDVDALEEGEQTTSIISKLSKMFRNIRFLKKQNDNLGTIIKGNVTTLRTGNSWTQNAKVTFEESGIYQVFAWCEITGAGMSVSMSLTHNEVGGHNRQSIYSQDGNVYSGSISDVFVIGAKEEYVSLATWSSNLTSITNCEMYAVRIK